MRALSIVIWLTAATAGAQSNEYYGLEKGSALYTSLVWNSAVARSSDVHHTFGRNSVVSNGTGVDFFFRSKKVTPGYSVCIVWRFRTSGEPWRRYRCERWFDARTHTFTLLKAGEERENSSVAVDVYDVPGLPEWDGQGKPKAALARTSYVIEVEGMPPGCAAESFAGLWHYHSRVLGSSHGRGIGVKGYYVLYGEPHKDCTARFHVLKTGYGIQSFSVDKAQRGDVVAKIDQIDGEAVTRPFHLRLARADGTGELEMRVRLARRGSEVYGWWHYQGVELRESGFWGVLRGTPSRESVASLNIETGQPCVISDFVRRFRSTGVEPSVGDSAASCGVNPVPGRAYAEPSRPSSYDAPTRPSSGSGSLTRAERRIAALAKCGMMYLGESECAARLEGHLGRSLGGLTCAAFMQTTFGGRIDGAELVIGALADLGTNSDNPFFQFGGLVAKGILFKRCLDSN